MARKVAVFDIDGTIIRSSLFVELTEELVRRGVFPHAAKDEYEAQHKKWVEREGNYEDYILAMVKTFKKHIKGVFYGDMADAAKAVVKEQKKRTYRYTRDLIAELKKKNYFLLAVSHSPKTILDYFCPTMGFDKAYGVLFDLGPEDNFTGMIIDEHLIMNKANVVKRAVEKEGLTLKGSIGVGDTESDISFLEIVQTPICFNPNSKLYKHAKLNDWKVVVERKDVIYEI
ncbi:MAG TPA: HAD-IB family phosphatase [Candidatus Paceibacterota bacterium]|nr:HAD-IB family phosphatase [Candidatus Paceibacterota bacterium]